MSSIVLRADSLTSKWGFGDGDALQDYLYGLQDGNSPWAGEEKFVMPDRDDILHKVVEKFLLPVLKSKGVDTEIYVIGSNHNPVRARTINGDDVTEFDTDNDYKHHLLEGVEVVIPEDDIMDLMHSKALKELDTASVRVEETYYVKCPKCKKESEVDWAEYDLDFQCGHCQHESRMGDF